jgi:hypothetical protein
VNALLAMALEGTPPDAKPETVVTTRSEGAMLDTFASLHAARETGEGCRAIANAKVVATDVTARISLSACEPDATVLGTDLVMVEATDLAETPTEGWEVHVGGRKLGPVVAAAGTKLLVARSGVPTERTRRAAKASVLSQPVKNREVSAVGRIPEPSAPDLGSLPQAPEGAMDNRAQAETVYSDAFKAVLGSCRSKGDRDVSPS